MSDAKKKSSYVLKSEDGLYIIAYTYGTEDKTEKSFVVKEKQSGGTFVYCLTIDATESKPECDSVRDTHKLYTLNDLIDHIGFYFGCDSFSCEDTKTAEKLRPYELEDIFDILRKRQKTGPNSTPAGSPNDAENKQDEQIMGGGAYKSKKRSAKKSTKKKTSTKKSTKKKSSSKKKTSTKKKSSSKKSAKKRSTKKSKK